MSTVQPILKVPSDSCLRFDMTTSTSSSGSNCSHAGPCTYFRTACKFENAFPTEKWLEKRTFWIISSWLDFLVCHPGYNSVDNYLLSYTCVKTRLPRGMVC